MKMIAIAAATWLVLGAVPAAFAAETLVRVVDIGAGLCVVARAPDGHVMVYDTGPGNPRCLAAVAELAPNHEIELLVLSHSDDDHIGGAEAILNDNHVAHILHPGDARPLRRNNRPTMLGRVRAAIEGEENSEDASLATTDIDPGYEFHIGGARAAFIAGWNDGHLVEGPGEARLTGGALNNALSIVIRFTYGGHSILLTGDTVGRAGGTARNTCKYAEARMVDTPPRFRSPARC